MSRCKVQSSLPTAPRRGCQNQQGVIFTCMFQAINANRQLQAASSCFWRYIKYIYIHTYIHTYIYTYIYEERNFKAADPRISQIAELCVCKQMKKPTRLAYEWKPRGRSHRDDHGVMQQVHRTLLLEVALQSIRTENQSNELHYIMRTLNPSCTAPPTMRKALKAANLPNHTSCSSHNASHQRLPN